ncbi:MAG: NDP-sugar synthase [Thermoplasmata archaeon]|nr:NDP-sugar synthase [Thermoplasmata archaeon]
MILAGGEGTRLRPLTEKRPKPLMPVAGKLCVDYVLHSLVSAGFREIIITTGYLSDKLIKAIGSGAKHNASILYSFEDVPAGTAGAVKKVLAYLDDTVIVASGDVLADVNLSEIYAYHEEKKADVTMALTTAENPTEFGIVGLDENGKIVRFLEKPKPEQVFSNLINAGIYVLKRDVLKHVPDDRPFDFSKNLFPILLEKGYRMYGKVISGTWLDVGRPLDLLKANLVMTEKMFGGRFVAGGAHLHPGVSLKEPVYVDTGTRIMNGCRVENACVYDGVHVEENCTLEGALILHGVRIGRGSQIKNSILSDKCVIEENAVVEDSIIGENVIIKRNSVLKGAMIAGIY